MLILPAIDLYEKKAVRLHKGDYTQMTVYNDHPLAVAEDFAAAGAQWIHIVDLEGARDGTTPNAAVVTQIVAKTGLHVELGGGIRSLDTARRYLDAGVSRIILGTAALTQPEFLAQALRSFGERVAVGVDCRDGLVAIRGWTQTSAVTCEDFCQQLQDLLLPQQRRQVLHPVAVVHKIVHQDHGPPEGLDRPDLVDQCRIPGVFLDLQPPDIGQEYLFHLKPLCHRVRHQASRSSPKLLWDRPMPRRIAQRELPASRFELCITWPHWASRPSA